MLGKKHQFWPFLGEHNQQNDLARQMRRYYQLEIGSSTMIIVFVWLVCELAAQQPKFLCEDVEKFHPVAEQGSGSSSKKSRSRQFLRLLRKQEGVFNCNLPGLNVFLWPRKSGGATQFSALRRSDANSKHFEHHAGVDLIIWRGAGPTRSSLLIGLRNPCLHFYLTSYHQSVKPLPINSTLTVSIHMSY